MIYCSAIHDHLDSMSISAGTHNEKKYVCIDGFNER
jgi:hypothetical protein